MELTLQRRHKSSCPDRDKGPHFLKCKGKCRLWAYGCEENRKIYYSLKTGDVQKALRRIAADQEKQRAAGPAKKTVAEAIEAFLAHKGNRSGETRRKYERHMRLLTAYCEANSLRTMPQLTLEALDGYQQQHRSNRIGWHKHCEQLGAFFRFCVVRKWCEENPAQHFDRPEIDEPEEIVPYTREEVGRILRACDQVGRGSYERLRARAMVLLLRYTGMRISDVITLARENLSGSYIVRRSRKNRRLLRIEVPAIVLEALERLPHPKAAPHESTAYFAGTGGLRSLVKGAERLLWSVFRLAKVDRAKPHRFRHTFASELLAHGERVEVVADLLGDSVEVVRKHYSKWTPQWQAAKDQASRRLVETPSTKSSTASEKLFN